MPVTAATKIMAISSQTKEDIIEYFGTNSRQNRSDLSVCFTLVF